jgi:hypothetical protein
LPHPRKVRSQPDEARVHEAASRVLRVREQRGYFSFTDGVQQVDQRGSGFLGGSLNDVRRVVKSEQAHSGPLVGERRAQEDRDLLGYMQFKKLLVGYFKDA